MAAIHGFIKPIPAERDGEKMRGEVRFTTTDAGEFSVDLNAADYPNSQCSLWLGTRRDNFTDRFFLGHFRIRIAEGLRLVVPNRFAKARKLDGRVRFEPPVGEWGILIECPERPGFFGEVFGQATTPEFVSFEVAFSEVANWAFLRPIDVTIWDGVGNQVLWHDRFQTMTAFEKCAQAGIEIVAETIGLHVPPIGGTIEPDEVAVYRVGTSGRARHAVHDSTVASLALARGHWGVAGIRDGVRRGIGSVEVTGPGIHTVEWRSELPGPENQEILVTDISGRPRPGARIAYRSLDPVTLQRDGRCDGSAGPTREDGKVLVPGLIAGTYSFTTSPANRQGRPTTVQATVPGPPLHVELPPFTHVYVEIDTSPVDLDVVGDLWMGLRGPEQTDWDVHLVTAGQNEPYLTLPSNSTWEASGVLSAPGARFIVFGSFRVGDQDHQTVTLRGEPLTDRRGFVVHKDGSPANGCWVRATDADVAGLPEEIAWTPVNHDGSFIAVDPAGRGQVEVWDATRSEQVASGTEERLTVNRTGDRGQ